MSVVHTNSSSYRLTTPRTWSVPRPLASGESLSLKILTRSQLPDPLLSWSPAQHTPVSWPRVRIPRGSGKVLMQAVPSGAGSPTKLVLVQGLHTTLPGLVLLLLPNARKSPNSTLLRVYSVWQEKLGDLPVQPSHPTAEEAMTESEEVTFLRSHGQPVTELEAECRDPDNSSVGETTSRSLWLKTERQNWQLQKSTGLLAIFPSFIIPDRVMNYFVRCHVKPPWCIN